MRTIWKYELSATTEQDIEMPEASDILHVGVQGGLGGEKLCLWALVYPDARKVKRRVYVFGTGHPFKTDGPVDHIGTAMMHGGALVWHVFVLEARS